MAKTVIALFVRAECISYVASKGKRIIRWSEWPLEPGQVKDGVVADPVAVSSRIKELIASQRIRPRRVIAGITGLHCLTQTMVLPQLQRSKLAEAVRREAELTLPVPIDQLYLSWQTVASTSDAVNVFLAASPRNTVDRLVETLHLAGIRPHAMDLAPLALSRLGAGITGVIADIRPTEVDIIVNVDGLPQIVRSQTYPSEAKTIQEKLIFVREELERSIQFYDTSHPDKPLDAVAFSGRLPIHVSGKLIQDLPARQFLAGELNRSVLPVNSTLRAPHDFPAAQYMVNVGLACKDMTGESSDFGGVDVNVLPESERPKTFSYIRVAATAGAAIGAVALVFLSVRQVSAESARTASLKDQLTSATAQFNRKYASSQAQKLAVADLTKKVSAARSAQQTLAQQNESVKAVSKYFALGAQQINAEIQQVTTLATEVTLTSIDRSEQGVGVSGTAKDPDTVLSYARALKKTGLFSEVIVTSLQTTPAGVQYSLTLEEAVGQ